MKNIKNKVTDVLLFIPTIIIGLILSLVAFVAIESLQKVIFVPSDSIFYTFKSPESYLIFIFEVEIIILSFGLLNKFRESNIWEWAADICKVLKKHFILFSTLNLLLIYISLTSVAVVTPEKIINFNFYNPMGTTYKYDDVKDVETGFYGRKIGFFVNNSGNFYYKIKFKDNKEINFEDAISTYEDTYTEYVIFDKLVMAMGVKKTSSTENIEYASLDEVYINRLCSVINNKN